MKRIQEIKLILAHLMFSCPYVSLLPQSMASRLWTVPELISNFQCISCYQDSLNHWAPCVRISAMINTHPNLVSRNRQAFFIIFNFLKFLDCEPQFNDEDFKFNGEHSVMYHEYDPRAANRRKMNPYVPKYLQKSSIIRRGMYKNIFIMSHMSHYSHLPWHSLRGPNSS